MCIRDRLSSGMIITINLAGNITLYLSWAIYSFVTSTRPVERRATWAFVNKSFKQKRLTRWLYSLFHWTLPSSGCYFHQGVYYWNRSSTMCIVQQSEWLHVLQLQRDLTFFQIQLCSSQIKTRSKKILFIVPCDWRLKYSFTSSPRS